MYYYTKNDETDSVALGEKVRVYVVDVTEKEKTTLDTLRDLNGGTYELVNENLEHRIQKYNNDPRKIGADHYCDDMADDSWKKYL